MSLTGINVFDRTFKNPVIAASGTYGFGFDYSRYYNPGILGGIALKGLTLEPRQGNSGIRIWETPAGILNSIGLENPGLKKFKEDYLGPVRDLGKKTNILVNVAGHSEDDYCRVVEGLKEEESFLIELNLSCPNVKDGLVFGTHPEEASKLIKKIRGITGRDLIVKLTPNAPSITEVALAVEEAGASGVSLINTVSGMAIDVHRRSFVFENVTAGLSGPAVKPVALRMVYDVAKLVNIPVIGIGGIESAEDVIAFMMAGASLVEVGTANFKDPRILEKIIYGLEDYCSREDVVLSELIGLL